MLKKFGEFLLAKEANAIIVAFLAALLPVFNFPTGFIAVLVVGLVTLQKGPKVGLWVLSWVALPSIALAVLHQIGLFDLLILRCVVIWVLASLLRRYQTWNLLFDIVVVVGVITVAALHWWNPQLEQWWVTQLTDYMQKMIVDAKVKEAVTASAELAKHVAPIATGVVAFFVSTTVLMELAVVRWWQAIMFDPNKFAQEAVAFRAGKIASLLAALFFTLTMMKSPFAIDAFAVTLLPLFFAGLSLLHFLARRNKRFVYLLIVIYAGFIFLPVLVVSALAVVAFVDTWVDFRKRLGVVV